MRISSLNIGFNLVLPGKLAVLPLQLASLGPSAGNLVEIENGT